jgi:lambda family phage portal protein
VGLVDTLFPRWALARAQARLDLARVRTVEKRLYDAASPSPYRKPRTDNRSANAVMQHARETLRRNARYLDENHDLAVGVLNTLVDRIVGRGIIVEPMVRTKNGRLAYKTNEQIGKRWRRFCRRPEASLTLPMGEAMRLVCRTWLRDGETLTQHVVGDRASQPDPKSTPYMLELIEADYLPFDKSGDAPRIIQGVELAGWNRPIAYHLLKAHPGDMLPGARITQDTKRVSAELITHLKFTRRLHQVRGVPIFHAVLTRLEDIRDYEESERIAARVAAAFTGYIKKAPGFEGQTSDTDGARSFEMEPGMIWDNLMPGEEVGTIASNRPNPALSDFRSAMLRAVAAGTSTNFSSISKHYDGNYSSQRQELVESRMAYDALRQYFVDIWLDEVYRRWLAADYAAGHITPERGIDSDTLFEADYRGPGVPWIDPLKEVEADAKAVENGFKSRHQVIRERGDSPAVVDGQLDDDDFVPADQALAAAKQAAAVAPKPEPMPEAEPGAEADDDATNDADLGRGARVQLDVNVQAQPATIEAKVDAGALVDIAANIVEAQAATRAEIRELAATQEHTADQVRAYIAGFDAAQSDDAGALNDGDPILDGSP